MTITVLQCRQMIDYWDTFLILPCAKEQFRDRQAINIKITPKYGEISN